MLSGFSALGIGLNMNDPAAGPIDTALARRMRKRASVVAVDEAHTIPIDAGRALLHAVQRLRRMRFPVMLLLAGRRTCPAS